MSNEDTDYYILNKLSSQPQTTQRALANELGLSLGKVNYCLQALVEKGMVKARNFNNSDNKKRYLYVLTPSGLESKAALTKRFLDRKLKEYDELRLEIDMLQRELDVKDVRARKC